MNEHNSNQEQKSNKSSIFNQTISISINENSNQDKTFFEMESNLNDSNDNKEKSKDNIKIREITNNSIQFKEGSENNTKYLIPEKYICNLCKEQLNDNNGVFTLINRKEIVPNILYCQKCSETKIIKKVNLKDIIQINKIMIEWKDIEIYGLKKVDVNNNPKHKKLKLQINPKTFEIPDNSFLTYLNISPDNNLFGIEPESKRITGKKKKITNPICFEFDLSNFPLNKCEIFFLIKAQHAHNKDYYFIGNLEKMKVKLKIE